VPARVGQGRTSPRSFGRRHAGPSQRTNAGRAPPAQAGFNRPPDGLRMTMFSRDEDCNRTLWDLAYEPEATSDR
jgi:hypothetical protein